MYQKQGLQVRTGLNPLHFRRNRDSIHTAFTAIYKNGRILSTGGGIALQEVYFFECLFSAYQPSKIFVVGNAFGWSTLLLSILNPQAKVVALDAGLEGKDTKFGINLTNKIAREESLNLLVVQGTSPQDVKSVISAHLDGSIDFAFIDGLHTEKQQDLDYSAISQHLSSSGFCVFHDVINFKMKSGFSRIAQRSNLNSRLLYRTPSGMGVIYPDGVPVDILRCIDSFTEDQDIIESVRRQSGVLFLLRRRVHTLLNRLRKHVSE